jgi:hypothetical protein
VGPMPIYQFVVRSDDHEDDPDVRWSHLPDEDAARRYGHLLIKDFKSSGRYADSSHLYVVVKDEMRNYRCRLPDKPQGLGQSIVGELLTFLSRRSLRIRGCAEKPAPAAMPAGKHQPEH